MQSTDGVGRLGHQRFQSRARREKEVIAKRTPVPVVATTLHVPHTTRTSEPASICHLPCPVAPIRPLCHTFATRVQSKSRFQVQVPSLGSPCRGACPCWSPPPATCSRDGRHDGPETSIAPAPPSSADRLGNTNSLEFRNPVGHGCRLSRRALSVGHRHRPANFTLSPTDW